MSINSINQIPAEQDLGTLLQTVAGNSHKSSTFSQLSLYNTVLSATNDSINISSSMTLQTNQNNLIQFQNQESIILESNSAKNSVNTILSFIQNNGSQVLNSIRMPCTSVVLNLISDSV
jgi:hypothetical protein